METEEQKGEQCDIFRDTLLRYMVVIISTANVSRIISESVVVVLLKASRIVHTTLPLMQGYANELGESFRPIFPRLYVPSYIASFSYVLADSVHKCKHAYRSGLSTILSITHIFMLLEP